MVKILIVRILCIRVNIPHLQDIKITHQTLRNIRLTILQHQINRMKLKIILIIKSFFK
jgi:hypothetical protein